MSHQTLANADHVPMKLIANTSIVQRHLTSTNVVKMSYEMTPKETTE